MRFDEELFVPNLTRYTGHKFQTTKKKGFVLQKSLTLIPNNIETLYEPFAGLGCVSFNALAQNTLDNLEKVEFSDVNPYLVKLFNDIKNKPFKLIKECEKILTDDIIDYDKYYLLRDDLNSVDGLESNSALTLILMYNMGSAGMKLNPEGKCGISYASHREPSFKTQERWIVEIENKVNVYNDLMNGDVEVVYKNESFYDFNPDIKETNLIILDPPYDGSLANYGVKTKGLYNFLYSFVKRTCNDQNFIVYNYLHPKQLIEETMVNFWFKCPTFGFLTTNQRFNIQNRGGPDHQCGIEVIMHNTDVAQDSRI